MTDAVKIAMVSGLVLVAICIVVIYFGPERVRPFFSTTATLSLATMILLFLASVAGLV